MADSIHHSAIVDILEEDPSSDQSLASAVRRAGHEARVFQTAESYFVSAPSTPPDCVLLNKSLANNDGLGLLERLAGRGGPIPVIAISGQQDVTSAVRITELGAMTVLDKPFSVDRLQEILGATIESGRHCRAIRNQQADLAEKIASLSSRELSVVDAIAAGKLNREIAEELGVSVRTVESDRSRVVHKLDAKTTGEAIAKYSRFRTLSLLNGNGHP